MCCFHMHAMYLTCLDYEEKTASNVYNMLTTLTQLSLVQS